MKPFLKILLWAACTLAAEYCAAQVDTQYLNKKWKDTTKANASYFRTVKKDGPLYFITDHFMSGKVQMTGHYWGTEKKKDSAREGVFEYFDSLGMKTNYETYTNGILEGLSKIFDSGVLTGEGQYVNGTKNGAWHFYEKGKIAAEGSYSGGKKNGLWKYYFMGMKSAEGEYAIGEIINNWKYYYLKKDILKFNDTLKHDDYYTFDFGSNNKQNCITSDLKNATFFSNSGFPNTRFLTEPHFSHSVFERDISFRKAAFDSSAYFIDTKFKSDVYFSNASFSRNAYFTRAKFYGETYFANANFDKDLYFDTTVFYQFASFQKASFQYTSFEGARFLANVDFYQGTISDYMDFSYAVLKNKADFSAMEFDEKADISFDNTSLPDTIDFSYDNKIPNEIDLTICNFKIPEKYDSSTDSYKEGKWHYINLHNADIPKFHFDYFHFRLIFVESISGKQLPIDETKSIYEAVLKNFKDHGQMDSHMILNIEYHDFLLGKFKFLRWWNLYGYHKEWVFYWALGFLLLFTVITYLNINNLTKHAYKIEYIPDLPPLRKIENTRFEAVQIRRRWWYSFVYTASIFFLFSLKIEKIKFKNRKGVIYIIIMYTAGIICIAYMANFVLQK